MLISWCAPIQVSSSLNSTYTLTL